MAFIGLLAHISTDVFESYMYRGLATAVTFLVLFCFILSTVILGKKSAILFFKEVEKALKINEMDCHQRKFVFAQIDTKVSGGMPKSIPAHFVQAVFGSIIWFGLLYWEGIIQMEYNTFGPVFVCAHVFLTTWCLSTTILTTCTFCIYSNAWVFMPKRSMMMLPTLKIVC